MTETVTVENAGRSDLTLPCGTRIPAGARVPVALERLREHIAQPVTRHWFEERILRTDEPVLTDRPAVDCDCLATRDRLADAEDKLRTAVDRLQAERAARGEAEIEVARLTAALAAETKARAEAEALARLAAEETEALKAAAAKKAAR